MSYDIIELFKIEFTLHVRFSAGESLPIWSGRNIDLTLSAETIVSISEMQVNEIALKNTFSFYMIAI